MAPHRLLLAAIALLLGATAFNGMQFSSASFTATSTAPMTVTAANDWTPPTVVMTNPGSPLTGTATVSATASDARSSVASVVIQRAPNGSSSWTTICTDNVAPYSCSWLTTTVTDGTYQLRAVATDTAGYSATSTTVTTTVVNSATVTLTPIADLVRGGVPLHLTVTGNAGAPVTNRFEYAISDANPLDWKTIPGCANATGTTRSCTWATSGGQTYDVRAVAAIGSQTYYDTQADVEVDNNAPTVSVTVPSGTLRGTVVLGAVADDDDSGVESVALQYRRASSGSWITCGTTTDEPYTCSLNTTTLVTGSYEFQAVATDAAGNSTTSKVEGRTVDNTVATVSITSPTNGSTVAGSVTVTAAANASQGVASVRIEARIGTSGSFIPLCTDTTAPYTCTYDSSVVPAGSYQVQAVMSPKSGADVTSTIVTITVDNTPLKAQDVQGANGGTARRADAGDRIVLTYSARVDLGTIKSGWTGQSTPVPVTLKDSRAQGSTVGGDRLEFSGANLGQVGFSQNFIKNNGSVVINGSTMTAATATVSGVQVTVVTITLGTPASTGDLRSGRVGTMTWAPSTAARNLFGVACSAAAAAESGARDEDL